MEMSKWVLEDDYLDSHKSWRLISIKVKSEAIRFIESRSAAASLNVSSGNERGFFFFVWQIQQLLPIFTLIYSVVSFV